MKRRNVIWVALLLVTMTVAVQSSDTFDRFFVSKTMRVDYFHTGTKTSEIFSLDQVYEEPIWAGSKVNLIDTLNLGKYLVKVFDVQTNQLIYSRGFCSIFGEWQTTTEAAQGVYRTFHESVLFPFPKRSVQVVIAVRDNQMHFQNKFSTVIDPNSRFVNREKHDHGYKVYQVFNHGPCEKKVDLLILGDGYTAAEMEKFRRDVQHYVGVMFDTSPFKERKKDFNVWAMEVISPESGIDKPRKNVWKHTALGASYNSLDSQRYILTLDNRTLRDIASGAPYDFLYILINSNQYGGGGIFNLYSTCFTGTDKPGMEWQADYVFVHEFGHSFGGLADEYYTSAVAYTEFYPRGVEPWEPNITALLDKENLKWKDFLEPGTPLPTPWDKAIFDSLEAVRAKLDRNAPDYYEKRQAIFNQQKELLHKQKYWGKVGAFEGAGYCSEGLYRPYLDCRMFSLSLVGFDPVCRAAIERMIDFYTR